MVACLSVKLDCICMDTDVAEIEHLKSNQDPLCGNIERHPSRDLKKDLFLIFNQNMIQLMLLPYMCLYL